jgi:cytochrome P450
VNAANEAVKVDHALAQLIVSPRASAEPTALDQGFRWLRANNPVGRVEIEGYDPFWLITRQADIVEISRQADLFHSGDDGTVLQPRVVEDMIRSIRNGSPHLSRAMINMDAPEHLKYRRVIQAWFMPQKLQAQEKRIRRIARSAVDRMASFGGACDFVCDVALHYPLRVMMDMLGVPPAHEPLMLRLTKELVGQDDDDLRRDARSAGMPRERLNQRLDVLADFERYFTALAFERRKHPRDDLASVIANAEIDGVPIGLSETIGCYILLATAGHETTSSSISTAIWALCERPDEFQKVKADRSLIPRLVEEAVRTTSPAAHVMRTATAETSLRGRTIARGDRLMLCYHSGNRDEEIFDDPDEFRVDRDPTRHRAFGNGAHVCLGQHLARLEMRIFFEELLARLERIAIAGQPRRSASTFAGGPKSVPVRFRIN